MRREVIVIDNDERKDPIFLQDDPLGLFSIQNSQGGVPLFRQRNAGDFRFQNQTDRRIILPAKDSDQGRQKRHDKDGCPEISLVLPQGCQDTTSWENVPKEYREENRRKERITLYHGTA